MLKKVYLVTLLVTLAFLLLPSKIFGQSKDATTHTLTGNIIVESDFSSKNLANKRNIIIYLPPNYKQNSKTHYPVLYLHDGQNIFDQATSFIGQEWQCDETAEKLILANKIQPIIIVGIYNAGQARIDEYTPSVDAFYNGGKANLYSKFLIEELKPFIDKKYRTLKDPDNTALGGSSLGGLVSLFIGLQHPQIFGKLALVSPSVWWDNKVILKDIEKISSKPKTKIWLDIGSQEGEESIPDTNRLKEAFVNKGWQLNRDLKYLVVDGAKHNEEAWAKRFDKILEFLFPKK
ncbi:MAG: alpha/beta hydrolase-fold protein [Blastocatellia bacterium]